MRRKQKGVRSLAEIATLPKTEIIAGDAGLRYNGLKRFQQEEAIREAEEKRKQNAARFDALVEAYNDPVLAQRCPTQLQEFPTDQVPEMLAGAWDRFEKRRLAPLRLSEINTNKIKTLIRRVLVRNPELAWVGDNADNCFDWAWDYLVELGALDRLGLDNSGHAKSEPAPQQVDALEKLNGETREGRDSMQWAANKEFFLQARPIWAAWKEQIFCNYKVLMNDDTEKLAFDWFVQSNKSWTHKPNYDECRRYLVAIGAPRGLPKYCLTRDEMEANRIESDPEAASDSFEAKLKFRQRRAQVLDEIKVVQPEV